MARTNARTHTHKHTQTSTIHAHTIRRRFGVVVCAAELHNTAGSSAATAAAACPGRIPSGPLPTGSAEDAADVGMA